MAFPAPFQWVRSSPPGQWPVSVLRLRALGARARRPVSHGGAVSVSTILSLPSAVRLRLVRRNFKRLRGSGLHPGAEVDHDRGPICGCSVESAPEHLPPPLNGPVTSASASMRMAGAPMVACVTLQRPAGVERQLAIDAHPVPRPPCPSWSLLAQTHPWSFDSVSHAWSGDAAHDFELIGWIGHGPPCPLASAANETYEVLAACMLPDGSPATVDARACRWQRLHVHHQRLTR